MSGMLFHGEQEAIDAVLKAGANFGYGNMIAYLKRDWVEMLMRDGISEKGALQAANSSAYPVRKDKI